MNAVLGCPSQHPNIPTPTRDDADCGRLAGAVGPQQGGDLARGYVQRQTVHRHLAGGPWDACGRGMRRVEEGSSMQHSSMWHALGGFQGASSSFLPPPAPFRRWLETPCAGRRCAQRRRLLAHRCPRHFCRCYLHRRGHRRRPAGPSAAASSGERAGTSRAAAGPHLRASPSGEAGMQARDCRGSKPGAEEPASRASQDATKQQQVAFGTWCKLRPAWSRYHSSRE